MTEITQKNRTLDNHINYENATKTICVTTCLNFFKIPFDSYHYTSSHKNVKAYENVLRRFGYAVRSRISELKIKKGCSLTNLKTNLKKSAYGCNDYFIVHVFQSKKAHLLILDGNGQTIVDTAVGMKWRVATVDIVYK